MNANILDRLNATLEAAAAQRLADLDHFEANILGAIERAEQAAQKRIEAKLADIDHAIAGRMLAFQDRLADMTTQALTQAVNHLAGKLDPEPTETPEPVSEPASHVPEEATQPEPIYEEDQADLDGKAPDAWPYVLGGMRLQLLHCQAETEGDQAEQQQDLEAPPTTSAHAVATERPALLPGIAAESMQEVPTTTDPEGLHERRGEGRGRRYVAVGLPVPGECYHRKVDGRWQAVRYAG